jgi:formamidopyrimidine-DNA glycosylase
VPELPEVEVVRRRLRPLLVGRRIVRVVTTRPSYFFLTPPGELRKRLVGRRATGLDRHGKYLMLSLDDRSTLLLHLGMTGQLFAPSARARKVSGTRRDVEIRRNVVKRRAVGTRRAVEVHGGFRPDAHTHLALHFDDAGPSLYFRDARKFGKCAWLAPGATSERLTRLGADALRIRGDALFSAAQRRRAATKLLLLDQSVFAGIGNIYADEALFFAGTRPTRRAERLTLAECERLAGSVRAVLRRAIAVGGSSISDYVHPDGGVGRYQDERSVYGRTGLPCRVCATLVVRKVIGQRSSHFCPRCQK